MYYNRENREVKIVPALSQATAEANNLSAVAEAKDLYLQMMECVCGGAKPFLATSHLESEHHRCVNKALHQFRNKRKMGGDEFSQTYMDKLEKVIIIQFVFLRYYIIQKKI